MAPRPSKPDSKIAHQVPLKRQKQSFPTRESILSDLEKAYQTALQCENVAAAVKVKELQLRVLGLLDGKRSGQALRPIQEMTMQELQALLVD